MPGGFPRGLDPFDEPETGPLGPLGPTGPQPQTEEEKTVEYNTFAGEAGLMTEQELRSSDIGLEAMLRQAGIDVEDPNVQAVIQGYGDMLRDPVLGPAMLANLAETYPAVPFQDYDRAFALSGFSEGFVAPQPPSGFAQLAKTEGLQVADFKTGVKKFEEQPDTGWIRFGNGTLVDPNGQVIFDPTSNAPGSLRWQREVVSTWSDEKVAEWRKRLHEWGYLDKDQVKVEGIDTPFLNALTSYHISRYQNGGKPVAGDMVGSGASGAGSRPPLVNFEDMQAQIRNDVREQYRRIFGEDPTDGEVQAWSDYIIRSGMDLQKKYRRKEYGNYVGMAATEAEERFIEKLEQSPEATFLRESDEENTRLRDALQQAVVVTNSLAG